MGPLSTLPMPDIHFRFDWMNEYAHNIIMITNGRTKISIAHPHDGVVCLSHRQYSLWTFFILYLRRMLGQWIQKKTTQNENTHTQIEWQTDWICWQSNFDAEKTTAFYFLLSNGWWLHENTWSLCWKNKLFHRFQICVDISNMFRLCSMWNRIKFCVVCWVSSQWLDRF